MHLNIKITPIRNKFITSHLIKLGKIKIPGCWRIQNKITRRQHTVMVVKFRVDFRNQYNDLWQNRLDRFIIRGPTFSVLEYCPYDLSENASKGT